MRGIIGNSPEVRPRTKHWVQWVCASMKPGVKSASASPSISAARKRPAMSACAPTATMTPLSMAMAPSSMIRRVGSIVMILPRAIICTGCWASAVMAVLD
jgi:hypothetical protein